MKAEKTQRFVEEQAKKKNKLIIQNRLSSVYVLTGIMVLLLSLIPMFGAVVLILWGVQIINASLGMAILLIIVGSAMLLAVVIGTIIFAIYYFTNDTERKLREIQYKDSVTFEDIFIKCENCGATLLVNTEICKNCGYKIFNEEEDKINKLKAYLLDTYNFEISPENAEIINSYITNSNFKFIENSVNRLKCESKTIDYKGNKLRESVLNKFIFNFKKIIINCCVVMVVLILLFVILSKYVLKF